MKTIKNKGDMEQIATVEMPDQVNVKVVIRDGGIHFSDPRLEGVDKKTIDRAVIEQAIITAFEADEICPSEVGELLGIPTYKAREWLHSRGVASYRLLPPEIEEESYTNMEKLAYLIPEKK